jgi:RimJ/RimL family protein N-acetyltransferase
MRKRKDITNVIRVSALGLSLILPKLKDHLMALPEDDKYLRFYTPVNESFVDRYLSGITLDARGDAVFVVYNDTGEVVVGMCHVAIVGTDATRSAELALSVSTDHRNRHIGIDMLERAILHCKSLGINKVFMYCLSSNRPMQAMARKLDMKVVTEYDESTGTLMLPEDKRVTAQAEAYATDTVALIDLSYRQLVNAASIIMAAAWKPFTMPSGDPS